MLLTIRLIRVKKAFEGMNQHGKDQTGVPAVLHEDAPLAQWLSDTSKTEAAAATPGGAGMLGVEGRWDSGDGWGVLVCLVATMAS